MRIVLVGGGTGGHFNPLMAVAESLRKKRSTEETELFYIGPGPHSKEDLLAHDITYVYCPAGKQREYRSFRNYTDIFLIIAGIFVAFVKLFTLYPDVLVSKGGYTSVPVVIAAWLLRIPIIIHESDAVVGKANKLAAPLATYIGIAHDDVAGEFPTDKVALVGMPIQSSLYTPIEKPHQLLGIGQERKIILVTGGSQGSERLNNLVIESLDELLQNYTVLHLVGSANVKRITDSVVTLYKDERLLENYYAVGSLSREKMAAALQACSLVITRAGSTTLFETALLGKPSIIVPIPEDVSRDQRTNAYAYARGGGGIVIEEKNLEDTILDAEVKRILENSELFEKMSTAAKNFTSNASADTLADTIITIARSHEE